jgi:hypothetical protein
MSGEIALTGAGAPLRVVSMRLLHPFKGVWLADVEIDPDQVALAPSSGKVKITIGQPPVATLLGTIDPRGSGDFVGVSHRRVLGGGAGWDKTVSPQHFHSDGGPGVVNTTVIAATAGLVGEVANIIAPSSLGADFVRSAGPASRVLDGTEWWLDLTGVTQVGPRPPAAQPAGLTLIKWDPTTQSAEVTCDTVLLPGTLLVDPRLPSAGVTVRDVEQRFDGHGSSAVAWCGVAAVEQLMGDLRSMVEEFSGKKFLATYLYRIVQQNSDGRLQLQAVDTNAGVPDTLPIAPWTGHAGASAKYRPGTLVRVGFLEGDPSEPIADSYEPGVLPKEVTIDAEIATHVGPSSPLVDLAGGLVPLVVAPWAAGVQTALLALAVALAGFGPLAGAGTALGTALNALPPAGTKKVTGQ